MIKELYNVDVSPTLISHVTDKVIEEVMQWQARLFYSLYPIVYLDCIVLKKRDGQRIINKSVYLALGINVTGHKELLEIWLSENEGSRFWLGILTELKNRGVQDIGVCQASCPISYAANTTFLSKSLLSFDGLVITPFLIAVGSRII